MPPDIILAKYKNNLSQFEFESLIQPDPFLNDSTCACYLKAGAILVGILTGLRIPVSEIQYLCSLLPEGERFIECYHGALRVAKPREIDTLKACQLA